MSASIRPFVLVPKPPPLHVTVPVQDLPSLEQGVSQVRAVVEFALQHAQSQVEAEAVEDTIRRIRNEWIELAAEADRTVLKWQRKGDA